MLPRSEHQRTPHTLAPENPSKSEKLIPGRKHAPLVPYEANTCNVASVEQHPSAFGSIVCHHQSVDTEAGIQLHARHGISDMLVWPWVFFAIFWAIYGGSTDVQLCRRGFNIPPSEHSSSSFFITLKMVSTFFLSRSSAFPRNR